MHLAQQMKNAKRHAVPCFKWFCFPVAWGWTHVSITDIFHMQNRWKQTSAVSREDGMFGHHWKVCWKVFFETAWYMNMISIQNNATLTSKEPWSHYHWTMMCFYGCNIWGLVPARLWWSISWPAPLWPLRWDTGYWDGSRNIHSGSLWPVCWSFVFSSCAERESDGSDVHIFTELVWVCLVASFHFHFNVTVNSISVHRLFSL